MCSRALTFSSRYCRRRVTVSMRNDSHSSSSVAQAHDARAAVARDDVEVDAVGALEVGRGEQVRHDLVGVDPVRARRDDEPRRVLVVGLVAQVLDHRQLLRAHLRGDLLEHLRARDLVRQLGDDDLAVLDLEAGPRAERAVAGLVDLQQLFARRDDLGARREVRAQHVLAELRRGRLRFVEQPHAGRGHFAQVVRRYVRGHADRDAGRAVQQQVRQARRQQRRLVERAVEVRLPVDGALPQLGQQHLGVARELRLGVAHRRERLGVVGRTEVALPVDDRIAVREGLGHQHHRLVAGRVAVRMELADHVADGARRLLVLGGRGEAELAHRVDDAALHGLQPVADVRQRAVEDHVHRVLEVRALGEACAAAASRRRRIRAVAVVSWVLAIVTRSRSRPAPHRLDGRDDTGEVALGFEPVTAVRRALLGEQHVHELVRVVRRIDRQLHQPARLRRHGRLAQLQRVHFAEALEARDRRLRARVLGADALEDAVALGVVERVGDLLAVVDAVERRHRDVDVARGHQRPEVPQEQRAEQRRDVQAVRIGVGEDADLVVAQVRDVVRRPGRRRWPR